MKRKSRRAKGQKVFPLSGDLKLIEPDAAAVDVGSRSHWVAVNPERDPNPVREFGTFSADLMSLADWFAQCEVKVCGDGGYRSLLGEPLRPIRRAWF